MIIMIMESNVNSNENIYYGMQPTEYQNLNQAASNMIRGVTPFHQTAPYPYSYHHVNQIPTQITTGKNQEHQPLSQSEQQMNYSAATEHLYVNPNTAQLNTYINSNRSNAYRYSNNEKRSPRTMNNEDSSIAENKCPKNHHNTDLNDYEAIYQQNNNSSNTHGRRYSGKQTSNAPYASYSSHGQQSNQQVDSQSNVQQVLQTQNPSVINMNVLKYATTHDLPPFILKFEEEEKLTRNRLPGAMHIKSFIQSDLWKAGVKYFTPSQLSLVLRNVPQTISKEVAEQDVKYSIKTAINFRKLIFVQNTVHRCSNVEKCAQYMGNHLSTAPSCEVNQNHRQNLNEAVKKAIEDGRIQATVVNNHSVPVPRDNLNEFPRLNSTRQAPWMNKNNNQQHDITNNNTTRTINNSLEMKDRNARILDEMRKLNESTDLKLN
ncbi:unnamed protein product [Didymodactylos carnosus]|uniref:Uncharacterized protein n=1 Tax=Didymodactylos carnosus TaxID=1234261 RepID=A0A815KA36_9BILA|nr:unnamed protein product [Didymodactylos carnosus]CAF4281931.1 unnamed protein product [Didymodactylos carnosus]